MTSCRVYISRVSNAFYVSRVRSFYLIFFSQLFEWKALRDFRKFFYQQRNFGTRCLKIRSLDF